MGRFVRAAKDGNHRRRGEVAHLVAIIEACSPNVGCI
jgi:hypothetical protein